MALTCNQTTVTSITTIPYYEWTMDAQTTFFNTYLSAPKYMQTDKHAQHMELFSPSLLGGANHTTFVKHMASEMKRLFRSSNFNIRWSHLEFVLNCWKRRLHDVKKHAFHPCFQNAIACSGFALFGVNTMLMH